MITTLLLLALLQNPPQVEPVPPPVDKPAVSETQKPTESPKPPEGQKPAEDQRPVEKPLVVQPLPQAGPQSPVEWHLVDAIQLIVNEESVTSDDFFIAARKANKPTTTEKERAQLAQDVASEIVGRLLKIQAGKDLGFDEKLVDRLVRDEMDQTVERAGSVMALGNALNDLDMDPQMLRDDKKASIYRQLWEGDIDGRMAGPGGRVHVDRYVRPGALSFEYVRREAADPTPATVMLQVLNIGSQKSGGSAKALELIQSLRERVIAGEDFAQLVEDFGSHTPGTHGMYGPFELGVLRASAEFGPFFGTTHEVGDLSEPLPIRVEGELRGYRLVKVMEFKLVERPSFALRETQNQLRQAIENRLQNFRRDRGLTALLDAAYVWPPEAFGRAKPEPQLP